MWDLSRIVQIQKARHALRDGHLDEAFSIVTGEELKDHRQGQAILEQLREPFLRRARQHLDAGRLHDALEDARRAADAGGNRPETAAMRQEILEAMERRDRDESRSARALDSVREHLKAGRLGDAEERLATVSSDEAGREELATELTRLRQIARDATGRVEELLERGEVGGALQAGTVLRSVAAAEPDTTELLRRLVDQAESRVALALKNGHLESARRLAADSERLEVENVHLRQWIDAITLANRAARDLEAADWSSGRVHLTRLEKLLPGARWVSEARERMEAIDHAVQDLRVGPLGDAASRIRGHDVRAIESAPRISVAADVRPSSAPTGGSPVRPAAAAGQDEDAERGERGDRFVLWIDGVGSYLLLLGESVTLGRAGSSNSPDVALAADILGVHAQILRVDHDYFLVPRGPTTVGGSPVDRHLLADGDEIRLGPRTPVTFRLPTRLSSTAILKLKGSTRLSGDVRSVILLDENVVFAPPGKGHLPVPKLEDRVVLSRAPGGFRCLCPVPLVIEGRIRSKSEILPTGVPVEAGPLTFTLTAATREGGEA